MTMKAMAREKNMAALEPIGMGRIYGPISPPTKAIGSTAAITAKVARMVGLPTSFTASTAMSGPTSPFAAGQMKMPHDILDHDDGVIDQDADGEDQREKRNPVERVSVEIEDQQRQREGGGIAMATIADSRQPSVNRIRTDTPITAMPMCSSSSLDFSAAVSP